MLNVLSAKTHKVLVRVNGGAFVTHLSCTCAGLFVDSAVSGRLVGEGIAQWTGAADSLSVPQRKEGPCP